MLNSELSCSSGFSNEKAPECGARERERSMESVLLGNQPAALDVKEVWFSNMHLLGLRPEVCEEQYKVTLERNMFDHINKRGSEAVLHFLFSRLDPKQSSELFR